MPLVRYLTTAGLDRPVSLKGERKWQYHGEELPRLLNAKEEPTSRFRPRGPVSVLIAASRSLIIMSALTAVTTMDGK